MTCSLLKIQALRAVHTAVKRSLFPYLMGWLSLKQWDMKQEYTCIHHLESIDVTAVSQIIKKNVAGGGSKSWEFPCLESGTK